MAVLGIIILLGVGVVTATVVANGAEQATFNLVGLDVTHVGRRASSASAPCACCSPCSGCSCCSAGPSGLVGARKEVKDLRRRADAPAGTATEDADQPVGRRTRRPTGHAQRRPGEGEVGEHFKGVPRD